ncbi:hypothetical protein Fot_04381 [Forsythia ovata]|uniref:Uncharacterized protein n=1 Tax=Forsythia ovata TaxID=205694 RepID=A0ABD1XCF0_9LAMI
MNRIAKIELKQSEIEAKQAEILSFQRDLKSQLHDLSRNVQSMIADFLNQMEKKFNANTEEVQVEDNVGFQLKDLEVESQVFDDVIQIDDIIPSAPRKRIREIAAVSSGKSKAIIREIRSSTYALSDEINVVDVNDIVDFEEWFNVRLCKNNK